MKLKKIIILFFLFIIINLVVSGANTNFEPFYILESIMIPIENNIVVFSRFILNCFIVMIIIYSFISICHDIFSMYPFIVSRNGRKGLMKLYSTMAFKELAIILFVKLIADLCTNNISGFWNFSILIKLNVSIILTSVLWMIIIFLLYILFQSEKKSFFSILLITFLSQFFALKNCIFGVLSMTYIDFYLNFWILTIVKVIFIVIFAIFTIYIFNRKEFIGGAKND